MGFFKKLFGIKPADPTAGFPKRLVPPRLVWDSSTRTFAGIPLPASVEELAPFGPCDHFKVIGENYLVLTYLSLGVEFEAPRRQIQHISIFISENPFDRRTGLNYSRILVEPGGAVISAESDVEELTRVLGPAEKTHEDEEEVIQLFRNGPLCLEASYAPGGSLMKLEIYNDRE